MVTVSQCRDEGISVSGIIGGPCDMNCLLQRRKPQRERLWERSSVSQCWW